MLRFTVALLASALFLSPQAADKKRTGPERADQKRVTIAGCIDQRGDKYILTGDDELKKKAVLRGRTFSDENFARYLGHKVKVQGSAATDGEGAVINVDRIDDISGSCTAQ